MKTLERPTYQVYTWPSSFGIDPSRILRHCSLIGESALKNFFPFDPKIVLYL